MSSKRLEAVDQREFRRACGRFTTGVTVAAVLDGLGSPHGLTVNSFTSVSLNPPLVLVCIGHTATVLDHFRQATSFGISVLTDHQRELSDHFARKGHDRFTEVDWHPGPAGAPLIDRTAAELECRITQRYAAGDHDIFIGEVIFTKVHDDARPLLYFAGRYHQLT